MSLSFVVLSLSSCTKVQSWWQARQEIEWRKDGMESALAEAKKTNRPLFVYWGAIWCPPCNVLKAKVFPDSDFKQAVSSFIPVYLDGDTESAQLWGEKLNASGYPTLMVLNSAGKEVVRLSTNVSATEIAEVLKDAYNVLSPVPELLREIKNGARKPGPEEWRLLSRYSWDQDPAFDELRAEWGESLWSLKEQIPESSGAEKARLGLVSLRLRLGEGLEKKKLSLAQKAEFLAWLEKLFQQEGLLPELVGELSGLAGSIHSGLFEEKEKRARLEFGQNYKRMMRNILQSPKVSWDMRLNALYPAIDLAQTDEKSFPLSDEEKQTVVDECEKALAAAAKKEQRVAVVSDVSYYLGEVGQPGRARDILKSEMEKGLNPYYMMSGLAYLENKAGNKQEALDWHKQAYQKAEGRATRIQWGGKYLKYLVEVKPEDKAGIMAELKSFYTDNLKTSDAFMGRNKRVLDKLRKSLVKWGEERKSGSELQALAKNQDQEHCSQQRVGFTETYLSSCKEYFKGF
ncbi:MAG: thioredoxin family protein [Bdellovibrionaceae bacterium]|nr:thioredoxin family protein [Bdellovibrionales bacterium]MCB9083537.1 thioredoxin family protein [Pseudobdellovibrionaceae bacterium]